MDSRTGRLLVTGGPGWFADAALTSLARDPAPGLTHLRCLVHTDERTDDGALRARWGKDVEIVRGDLLNEASLARAVAGADTILHAAAVMHVRRIDEYYSINTEGTRRLARVAAEAGVQRFVYLSSNAAAGRSDDPHRLVRETDRDQPLSEYARSKWLGERWLFETPGPMARTVLRSCMFYGPPVPLRHVEVYRRVATGRMPLVGGGDYARSLTHIDNLVQGARLALSKAAANGQVYNIADREPYTTKKVVEAMARALGVPPRYLPLPALAADVAYQADWLLSTFGMYQRTLHLVGEATWNVGVSIEKARRELGYEPTVAIDEGMRGAVEWCRERRLL
ncbi:MAG: NAD-dependent epimerase/dehydratase family protein [Polyangiaceae bacterium]